MDAVVLAGGYATRLWPITKDRAKPLLPVAGRSIVDYILEELEDEERISSVYISTNKRFKEDFASYIEDSGYSKPELVIEYTEKEQEKLGTVKALDQLVEEKNLDSDLCVIAGDNLFSFNIHSLIDFYEEKQNTCVACYDVGSKNQAKSYGVVSINKSNKIKEMQEKPENPKSSLVSTACYVFPASTIKMIDKYFDEGGNPDAPGFFLEWINKNQEIYGYIFDGYWFDIGTPEGYLKANHYLLNGENLIENISNIKDSKIKNSYIKDTSNIKDSKIKNSYIKDTSNIKDSKIKNSIIFDEVSLNNCNLENCIVDKKSTIEKIQIKDSVIGERTKIKGASNDEE